MPSEGSANRFGPGTFEVVFVCTGNRARSPFAAEALRRQVGNLPVAVRSLGLLDLGPVPALPAASWAAERLGVDLATHRARPLAPGELATADLVVGFEPFHVAAAVVTGGVPRQKAFLITELSTLLEEVRSERASAAPPPETTLELADLARSQYGLPQSVADPLGRPKAQFLEVFERIDRLVAAIAIGLFGDRVAADDAAGG